MKSKVPDYLWNYVLDRGVITWCGEDYEFLVISSEFGRINGAPEKFAIGKDGILAISDACKEQWRKYYVLHELEEFAVFDPDDDACVNTLRRELTFVRAQEVNMAEYVQDRLDFFAGLVRYYEGLDELNVATSKLLARLKLSLAHLRQLAA